MSTRSMRVRLLDLIFRGEEIGADGMPIEFHRFWILAPVTRTDAGYWVAQIFQATDPTMLRPEEELVSSQVSSEDAERLARERVVRLFDGKNLQMISNRA